jgi:predicted 3-demethylubiquinone-9 3-methyltransferase (glyoxalase superfamily)
MQSVSTCLWFDDQSADAAAFYTSIFPNSRVLETTHYPEGGPRPAGMVLTVRFLLDGTEFNALNGGPQFPFSPAISLVANCDTQEQADSLWERLSAGGGKKGNCGWVTDKFGVSWQIVPRAMIAMLASKDKQAAQRAFMAMMTMTRIDMAAVQRAFDGVTNETEGA